MAIFIIGKSKCSICDQVLAPDQKRIATTHFIESPSHPLWRYSDSNMHYDCFQDWAMREEFVSLYNSTIGRIRWGNGTRHEMASDGVVRSVPAA
jgi:hypothetical protein